MKQLFSSHTTGWIVLAALLASSGHLAGCDTNAPEKQEATQPARADLKETEPSTNAGTQNTASAAPKISAPENQKNGDAEDTKAEKVAAAPDPKEVTSLAPQVSRLVIASDIKEREPVELTDAKIEEPVVAFVELKNSEEEEMGVVVTFEHAGGTKVGFVELTVPGNSPRFRTWARTRNIKTPGEWTAIVTSKSGEELARKTFQVAG